MWHCAQLFLVLLIIRNSWQACDRRPQGASGDRSAVDENFLVLIEGNPATYIPGQRYNISLSCDAALKFISFTLVVESEDPSILAGPETIGYFELIDAAETRFSSACENMIESTNANTKIRVSVGWVAPAGGCVLVKAAVLQHRNVWFIDDGFLTKRICPEEIDDVNSQTPPVEPCCACDEAKYELIVERKWGRNTHPHDFPVEEWRSRFSELIGASHSQDYRFWKYGALASRGLKEMAEHGATRLLELEVKSGDIRTIIKAPGITHRKNVAGTTLANVRVDPQHHVISLVTKIEPSPDWILGVAGLELCLENCTWISEKVLNLYPWDIGTDAGPSYMSPDQAQIPPDVVRRITSTSPNDERSPFYERSGAPMKPMATLYVRRKKLYERECESADIIPLECSTHPWNTWSECTTRCGPGTQYRTRAYKDPALAASFNCQVVLRQTRKCLGEQCGIEKLELASEATEECELTPWNAWTPCSRRCGSGTSTRTRDYTNPYEREKCLNENPVDLEQRKDCEGKDCGGRQTQSRFDEKVENNGGDLGTFEDNAENENANEEDLPEEDDTVRGMPQPEHPGSRYFGRQPNLSDDESLAEPAGEREEDELNQPLGEVAEQDGEEDNGELDDGSYNRNDNRPDGGGHNYRGRGATRYGLSNRVNDNFPRNNLDEGNDDFGIHEQYDENGHRAVYVESSDPSSYNVVQQFCFDKPYMRRSRCDRKILGVRNYWFYDADDLECKLFTTDDCDDNRNKFRSLEACEGTCLLPHKNQEDTQDIEEADEWGQQFGKPKSLTKTKPRRKIERKNRRRKPKEPFVGDIQNYWK
ncbi:spondin-1 isoform X2 [Rhagoletis pomonella]|uniref:spondin-1 isoform X2 n=1 Tax=Rhagoletis pomonella TaxID=28610 RepID=UPI00177F1E1C|nr:spondin-1 isoform X2 [Rhagoletis pomonella]